MEDFDNEDAPLRQPRSRGPRPKHSRDGEYRHTRDFDDRALTEDRIATDAGRLMSVLDEAMFTPKILPDPPVIPGYRTFWATTETKAATGVHYYRQLGYELVRGAEVPAQYLAHSAISTDAGASEVRLNEMILMKVPERRFLEIQEYLAHKKPLDRERDVRSKYEAAAEIGRSKLDTSVQLEGGVADLGRVQQGQHRGSFEHMLEST